MNASISSTELVEAFSTKSVTEMYDDAVVLTDLQKTLGTKGHLFVVRGDLAYSNQYDGHALTPKLWVYENMIKSARIQDDIERHPNYAFFDGVGPSGLEAMHFHAKRNKKKSVVVVAKEFRLPTHLSTWDDIEVIRADDPFEYGYVRKQAEVLRARTDLIFLNHALYAVQAMASIGNRVAYELGKLGIRPDTTVWCMAGGSCLYGIGGKIAEHFPGTETLLVELTKYPTIDPLLDLTNKDAVRAFARSKLREYSKQNPPTVSVPVKDLVFFPIHASIPNRYLLQFWRHTGEIGVDRILHVMPEAAISTHERLRKLGLNWTHTTALALESAIRLANEGKNVVTMVYGKNRNT